MNYFRGKRKTSDPDQNMKVNFFPPPGFELRSLGIKNRCATINHRLPLDNWLKMANSDLVKSKCSNWFRKKCIIILKRFMKNKVFKNDRIHFNVCYPFSLREEQFFLYCPIGLYYSKYRTYFSRFASMGIRSSVPWRRKLTYWQISPQDHGPPQVLFFLFFELCKPFM